MLAAGPLGKELVVVSALVVLAGRPCANELEIVELGLTTVGDHVSKQISLTVASDPISLVCDEHHPSTEVILDTSSEFSEKMDCDAGPVGD